MIPDFPHDIRIRLAQLNFFLLHPDVAKSLPCWLSQFSFSMTSIDNIDMFELKTILLCPVIALSLPCWLSQFRKAKLRQPRGQRLSNVRTRLTKISIVPILFLYHEESLVSSNLNSKQLRFHSVRPNLYIFLSGGTMRQHRKYGVDAQT